MLASSSRQALSSARKRVLDPPKKLSSRLLPAIQHPACHQQQRNAATVNVRKPVRSQSNHAPELNKDASSSSRLRNGPYEFNPELRPRTPAFIFNQRLEDVGNKLWLIPMFKVLKEMKDARERPDLLTYNAVLEALGKRYMYEEAEAMFDDMAGMRIRPDVHSFNYLLMALRRQGLQAAYKVLSLMEEHEVNPDSTTYMLIIQSLTSVGNLESSIRLLVEMEEKGLSPRVETAEDIVSLAALQGNPRLAIDLALNFDASSARRLGPEIWIKCLVSSAENLYKDGVESLWNKVFHEYKITPDEGTCMAVLHTAGRHGLDQLCLDAIRVLQGLGVTLRDYHFAPVVEAFSHLANFKDAFSTLSLMRSKGIIPNAETASPILNVLRENADSIDTAWTAIEELEKEGQAIDITAINTIIQGTLAHKDLQRAVGVYQILPELKVKPDVDTYNALFSGCIAAAHKELGEKILAEMREVAYVQPDAQTYERLIILALSGKTYEDAFVYLEEMKAANFYPPLSVYESIIARCVDDGDLRYKIALEEMTEFGYEITERLKRYIGQNLVKQ